MIERLKEAQYDDRPWTREELQTLAWERVKHEDWDEYDALPEKPWELLGANWTYHRETPKVK